MNSKTKLATLTALLALAATAIALAPAGAGAVAVQTTSACTQVTTPTGGVVLQCPVVTGGTVEAYPIRRGTGESVNVESWRPECERNPAACLSRSIGGGRLGDPDRQSFVRQARGARQGVKKPTRKAAKKPEPKPEPKPETTPPPARTFTAEEIRRCQEIDRKLDPWIQSAPMALGQEILTTAQIREKYSDWAERFSEEFSQRVGAAIRALIWEYRAKECTQALGRR